MRICIVGRDEAIDVRLIHALLKRDYYVTWLVDDEVPSCDAYGQEEGFEVIQCDPANPDSYRSLKGMVDVVYLLGRERWSQREAAPDLGVARVLAEFMRREAVQRCIYLTDSLPNSWAISYMRANNRVSRYLKGSGVPLTILRTGMVLAAGDRVFDGLVRLVERVRFLPRCAGLARNCRPMDPRDLVGYLVSFLDHEPFQHRSFDAGGLSFISLGDLLIRVAQARRLQRRYVRVPFGDRWFFRMLSLMGSANDRVSSAAWAERLSFQHGISGRNELSDLFPFQGRHLDVSLANFLYERECRIEREATTFDKTEIEGEPVRFDKTFPVSASHGQVLTRFRAMQDKSRTLGSDAKDNPTLPRSWTVVGFHNDPGRIVIESRTRRFGRAWAAFEIEEQGPGVRIRRTMHWQGRRPSAGLVQCFLANFHLRKVRLLTKTLTNRRVSRVTRRPLHRFLLSFLIRPKA